MKNFKLLSVILVLIVSLTSCEKDPIDWSTPPTNAKIYGEKLAPGSTEAIPDSWELVIENNILKEVIIRPSYFGSFSSLKLIYSSNILISVVNYNANNVLTAESFLNYNSNNELISIENYNSNNELTSTRLFNYSNPDFVEETTNIYNGSSITYTLIEYKKFINNNLVERFDSENNQHTTLNYDSKYNVFSNISNLDVISLYFSNIGNRISSNNKISGTTVFTYNGNVIQTNTLSYINTYDNENRITSSIFSNGIVSDKTIFSY